MFIWTILYLKSVKFLLFVQYRTIRNRNSCKAIKEPKSNKKRQQTQQHKIANPDRIKDVVLQELKKEIIPIPERILIVTG